MGENILKYTNGTYLIAPYNCIVSNISIPETGKICTTSNYIEVSTTDELYLSLNINETDINVVQVGQLSEITISANNKKFTGEIDKISDVGTYASNGSTFTAMIKFTNDGTIKLGMSAEGKIILEKAENAIMVPKEAIQTANNSNYVIVVNEDGTTKNVAVETGITNNVYTEVKSGLAVGEIVQYTTSSSSGNYTRGNMMGVPVMINGGGPMRINN